MKSDINLAACVITVLLALARCVLICAEALVLRSLLSLAEGSAAAGGISDSSIAYLLAGASHTPHLPHMALLNRVIACIVILADELQ